MPAEVGDPRVVGARVGGAEVGVGDVVEAEGHGGEQHAHGDALLVHQLDSTHRIARARVDVGVEVTIEAAVRRQRARRAQRADGPFEPGGTAEEADLLAVGGLHPLPGTVPVLLGQPFVPEIEGLHHVAVGVDDRQFRGHAGDGSRRDEARRTLRRMQEHHYEIELDAPPEEVWEVFWYRGADKPKPQLVTIDILHPGNEIGEGLVRHCTFPVPKVLGSGGVGQSWEWVTQVKPYESWRYDAVGKPLWSRAEGHIVLDDLGDGRTRLHFIETYETFNPWMRRIGLEKWVHEKISSDNDSFFEAINGGLEFHRARKAKVASAPR